MVLQQINNIKLIISDIDGTLLEYVTLKDLVIEAISHFGISAKDEYLEMQCNGVIEALNEACDQEIFSFTRLCHYWEKHLLFLKEYNLKVEDIANKMLELEAKYSQPIPNVKETLMALRNDCFRMICSTNWLLLSQKSKLKKVGLDIYFDKIYTCEGAFAKPNTKHFEKILDHEKIKPEEAVMIGDSYTDMAASKIGINTILLDRDNSKQNIYPYSNYVISDFGEIQKILKR